ncbi:TPA: GpE family phage tail protein [Escherichia coli]|nr:GpE family phage tail protein [Escherichia coli]
MLSRSRKPRDQRRLTEVLEWRYKAIQRSGANDE